MEFFSLIVFSVINVVFLFFCVEFISVIWVFAMETCYQQSYIWDKVFKNGPSKICGRHPLKKLKGYGLLKRTISLLFFKRFSSTNFTWSIGYFEYFVSYIPLINTRRFIQQSKILKKLFDWVYANRTGRLNFHFEEVTQSV